MLYKCVIFDLKKKKSTKFKIMAGFLFLALNEVAVCVCAVDPLQLKQKENVSKVKKVRST